MAVKSHFLTAVACAATLAVSAAPLPASAAKGDNSYSVLLGQDNFFGFYPSFNGLVGVSDGLDFSFYGILWTTSAFGTGPGSDLWTEFGAGVNLPMMDGKLNVKPQLGITNGVLLSTADVNDEGATGGNVFDGIVPSLTINYAGERFEAEWYSGYYAALRNRGDDGTLDFLHLWLNGGYRANDYFSFGAHFELLENTVNQGGDGATVYQWIGPYVQFSTPEGFFARFSAGADVSDGSAGDFYKLNVGMSF